MSYESPLLDSVRLEDPIEGFFDNNSGITIREAKVAVHRAAWLAQRKLDLIISENQVKQFRELATRSQFIDSCVNAIPRPSRPAWSLLGLEDDDEDPIDLNWLKEMEITIRSKAAVIYRKVVDEMARPLAVPKKEKKAEEAKREDAVLAQSTPEQLFDHKVQKAATQAAKKVLAELFDQSKNGGSPTKGGGKGRQVTPKEKTKSSPKDHQDVSPKGSPKGKGKGSDKGKSKGKGKDKGKAKGRRDQTKAEQERTQERSSSAGKPDVPKGGKAGKGKGSKKPGKGKGKQKK